MTYKYVVDTNVLMSILISGKSQYINMLSLFSFFLPDFSFIELNLYKNVLYQKTKLDENQFKQYAYTIFSLLTFIPSFIEQNASIKKAIKLCENVDIKDVNYVSLSIDSGLTLLTRDLKLYQGLRKQGFRQVELFETFLNKV